MHSILKAAVDAAPLHLRPSPPYHGGVDANPQLTNFGCAGVAIFIAEASSRLVADVIEEEQVEDWITEAKKIYSLHARAIGTDVKPFTKTKLRVLSDKDLKAARRKIVVETAAPGNRHGGIILPVPLRAANGALSAAIDLELVNGGPSVLSTLKSVASQVVEILPRKRVTPFLRELDVVLLREELRAVFAQRRDPRCEKIEACVWRGASRTEKARQGRASGAKVTHWIGRLEDGSYVLLWKAGARWQIVSGDRDYVLASVSDGQMDSAVSALMPSS
jgi:hypothetical protein